MGIQPAGSGHLCRIDGSVNEGPLSQWGAHVQGSWMTQNLLFCINGRNTHPASSSIHRRSRPHPHSSGTLAVPQ